MKKSALVLASILSALMAVPVATQATAAPRPILMWTSDVHGGYDVVTLYSDGSISEPVNDPTTYGEFPAISPDGKRVAFLGETGRSIPASGPVQDGYSKIYVADLDTGIQRLVYAPRGADLWALEWSPRGDQLLFHRVPTPAAGEPQLNNDLWVITEVAPGTWVDEPLITRPGSEQFATWSPDGSHVTYGYDPDTDAIWEEDEPHDIVIGISRADNTHHRNLTRGGRSGSMPAFSPDGRWIAFVDYSGPRGDIRMMRIDGSGKRTLADHRPSPWALVFSPDGRFLTWGEGTGWDSTRIVQLDLHRPARLSVLVDTPGIDHMPDYFPVP